MLQEKVETLRCCKNSNFTLTHTVVHIRPVISVCIAATVKLLLPTVCTKSAAISIRLLVLFLGEQLTMDVSLIDWLIAAEARPSEHHDAV